MADMSEEKKEKLLRTAQGSIVLGTDPIVRESESMYTYKRLTIAQGERDAAAATKLMQRKRNWELGHDPVTMVSTTRGSYGYKRASNKEKEAAEKLKKDLTTAHYSLGYEDDGTARQQSVAHQDMGPAALYSSAPTSHAKATKPPCSIMLGSDSAPALLSTSRNSYVKHDLKQLDTLVDGKSRSAMLRKSNVLIGTDNPIWTTNTSSVHVSLHGRPAEPVITKGTVNVTFGNDAPTYQSTIGANFSQVDALREACRNREGMDPAQKNELRAAHFVYGTEDAPWQTCSQVAFDEKKSSKADGGEMERIRSAMKKVSLTLGTDVPKYQSTIRAGYLAPPRENLLEAAVGKVREERKIANTRPNFDFGVDDAATAEARSCSSQHAEMRVGLAGVDYSKLSGLSDSVKADLRKHHFEFGNDRQTQLTTSQSAYIKMKGGPGGMDPAVKADLRRHHFDFGQDDYKSLSTTTRDQMVYHGRVTSELDPALKADLRAVHYSFGRDAPVTQSTYGNTYTLPRSSTVPRLS